MNSSHNENQRQISLYLQFKQLNRLKAINNIKSTMILQCERMNIRKVYNRFVVTILYSYIRIWMMDSMHKKKNKHLDAFSICNSQSIDNFWWFSWSVLISTELFFLTFFAVETTSALPFGQNPQQSSKNEVRRIEKENKNLKKFRF